MHAVVLLGGDFNYHGVDWSTTLLTDSNLPSCFWESLISFASDILLEQVNIKPGD